MRTEAKGSPRPAPSSSPPGISARSGFTIRVTEPPGLFEGLRLARRRKSAAGGELLGNKDRGRRAAGNPALVACAARHRYLNPNTNGTGTCLWSEIQRKADGDGAKI